MNGSKIIPNFCNDFIKNCNDESDEGCFFEVDTQWFEKLHELRNNLLFTWKNENCNEVGKNEVGKLAAKLHNKTE